MRPTRNQSRGNPATSHDVARLARVSRSAVSRAFTEGASVSDATRKKVLSAAHALKYRPNLFARSLITRRSSILGLAVSALDNQFYPEFVQRLSESFAASGYRLLLFITHGRAGPDPLVDELLKYRLDALILASSTVSSALAAQCRDAGVPVVMFNNVDPKSDVSSVAATNKLGAKTIAAYLLAAGHRRFGYITGLDSDSSSYEREQAFAGYLRKRELPEPVRANGHFTFDGAVAATRSLLSAKKPPDAIFCINDHMAFACLQTVQSEFGLVPGESVSVVGFDNVQIAGWPCFRLTSYSQPVGALVDYIVELVQSMIGHPQQRYVHKRIGGELVVRSSARVPASGLMNLVDGVRVWRPDKPID